MGQLKKKLAEIDKKKYQARYLGVVARIEAGDSKRDDLRRWLPGPISVKDFRKNYPTPRRKDNAASYTYPKTVPEAARLKRMRNVERQGLKPADVEYRTKHFRTDVAPTRGTCAVKARHVVDSKSATNL